MNIAGIEALPLRIPFKPGTRSAASAWGESFGFTGVPVTQRAIDEVIAPLCIGQDARRIVPLMREVQEKLDVFGRGGPLTHAISAVDIALWDIAGQAAGPRFTGFWAAAAPIWRATRA